MNSKASRYLNHVTPSTYYTTRRTRLLLEKKLDSVRSSTNTSSNSPPLVNEGEKEEEEEPSCQLEVSTVMEQQSIQQKGIGSPVSPMLCSFPLEVLGYSSPSCKDIATTTTTTTTTESNVNSAIEASASPPIGSSPSLSTPMNQSSSHIVSTAADTTNPCVPTLTDFPSAVGHSYPSRQSTNTLSAAAGHSSLTQSHSPPVKAITHPPSSIPTLRAPVLPVIPVAMHSTTALSSTNSIGASVSHSSLHDTPNTYKHCIPPNTLAYQQQANPMSCYSFTNSLISSSSSPCITTEESCITGTYTSSLQSAPAKDSSQIVTPTTSQSPKDASSVQEALQDEDDIR